MSLYGLPRPNILSTPAVAKPSVPIKSKQVVIGLIVVVSILAIVGFALYGRGLGDPNCNCTSPGQSARNFGTAIWCLIALLGVLVLVWKPEVLVST